MTIPDPRRLVEAPVRHAIVMLAVHGVVLAIAVILVVVCHVVPGLDAGVRDAIALLVPALLVAYALVVRGGWAIRGRPSEAARAGAWSRAREVDADDTMLALIIAGWVPVALAAALAVLAWPHLNDPNPQIRGTWGAIGVPGLVAAWAFASNTWLEATRDELARAAGQADARFRRYWADVGRS